MASASSNRAGLLLLVGVLGIAAAAMLLIGRGAPTGPDVGAPEGRAASRAAQDDPVAPLEEEVAHVPVHPAGLRNLPPAAVSQPARTVDLRVTDPEGRALLDRAASPLGASVLFWLRPHLVSSDAEPRVVPDGARLLRPSGSRVRSEAGWFTSFERPTGPTWCVLALGERVLAAERVAPDAESVHLVLAEQDVRDRLCAVRGSLPALPTAARHVSVRPQKRSGGLHGPVLAENDPSAPSGTGFLVKDLPPGPCRLVVRLDPARMVREIMRAADGAGSVSLGARAPDLDQWEIRMAALARSEQPYLTLQLELEPGQVVDVGALTASSAGVLVLELTDRSGEPIDAHGASVQLLSADGLELPAPTTWTYAHFVALHPLPVEFLDLVVLQGEHGTLANLRPRAAADGAIALEAGGDPFPPQRIRLERVSVVELPPGVDARLETLSGAVVRADPRWAGGAYRGHTIGDEVLLVPPGRYRLAAEGGAVDFSVGSASAVGFDVEGGLRAREPEALGEARRKERR